MEIQSRLIIGAMATPETIAALAVAQEAHDGPIGFCVFETTVGHKTLRCCWSGGIIDRATREASLTLVGQGAMEALFSVGGSSKNLIFAELKLGKTPLQEKVKNIILMAPDDSLIVFVGDLAKELDGHMGKAFNCTGAPIILEN
jgi:hypothetical protein